MAAVPGADLIVEAIFRFRSLRFADCFIGRQPGVVGQSQHVDQRRPADHRKNAHLEAVEHPAQQGGRQRQPHVPASRLVP